jgi:hypothetical protein
MIESGYICTGGSALSADICKNIHNPIPKLVLVNAINTLFIQFDSEVYLNDYFDPTTVTLTVTGP